MSTQTTAVPQSSDDPAEALIHALEAAVLAMGGPRPGRGVTNVRNVVLSWLAGKGQLEIRSLTSWDEDYPRTDHEDDALNRAARIAHADAGHVGRLDMCGDTCRALAEAGAY